MKQNQDAIARLRASYTKNGIELSEDLNTIRITARFLPGELDDLTEAETEDMTQEEVEQERKRRWELSWMWFVSDLTARLRYAGLHEAVYLSSPRYSDVEYRDFSDFAEAYMVQCDESEAGFGESEWDRTMGVRLVSRVPMEIIVDEDHPYLSVRDGVLFNKDQTELLWYPYGKKDETYRVPDGVTKIGYRAFAGYMTTVAKRKQDGSRVERLWRRVFNNVIDGDVDAGYERRPASVVKYVFNRNLRHVIMPDTVTVIEENAFDHCIFLKSVKLSSALAEIGADAFKGCKEMREISLPDSLERLIAERRYGSRYGTGFFPDNLERVNFLGTRCRLQPVVTSKTWKLGVPYITEPYTPKFFSEIFKSEQDVTITFEAGNERFASENGVIFNKDRTELIYCPRWKSGVCTVPGTVVRIGKEAFGMNVYGSCSKLIRVIFAGRAVTDIEDDAFSGCSSLQAIDLRSVKHIGNGAFSFCNALTHIDLRGVKHIGNKAFTGCKALTHIDLGSVEYIGDGTFSGCEALSRIDLGSVEYIGDRAFSDCVTLGPAVTIPGSCKRMSSFAFSCSKRLAASLETLRVPQDTMVISPDNALSRRWNGESVPGIERY